MKSIDMYQDLFVEKKRVSGLFRTRESKKRGAPKFTNRARMYMKIKDEVLLFLGESEDVIENTSSYHF